MGMNGYGVAAPTCDRCGALTGANGAEAYHVCASDQSEAARFRAALETWNPLSCYPAPPVVSWTPSSGSVNIPAGTAKEPAKERPATFQAMMQALADEALALCAQRQRKYGPTNITRVTDPLYGLAVRLGDKVARLEHLRSTGQGDDSADESVTDTLMDIANYALIGLAVQRGWWTRERGCPPVAP